MFGCTEFNAIYKSNLASQIIHPPVEKYTNLYELLQKGYHIGIEKEKITYLKLLMNPKHQFGEKIPEE